MRFNEMRAHFAALRMLFGRGEERDLSLGEALMHWRRSAGANCYVGSEKRAHPENPETSRNAHFLPFVVA